MNKILLAFTIFFTLAVSACQSTQNPSSQSAQNTRNGSEIPLLTIGNYQEYCDYVNSGTIPKRMEFWFNPQTYPEVSSLPDCFIPYEKFSMLGEFKLFVFSSEIRVGDFSSYSYAFRDDNGFEYSLYIDHNKKNTTEATTILSDTQANTITDLRTSPKSQASRVQIKNITYDYLPTTSGLHSLSWTENGITFTLVSDPATKYDNYSGFFSEYPMDGKDTFIKQLLTAPRTPAEIQQMCSSKLEKE